MFCANCGSKLIEGARFCSQCGAAAESPETPETPEVIPSSAFGGTPPQSARPKPNPSGSGQTHDDFPKNPARWKGFKPVLIILVLLVIYWGYRLQHNSQGTSNLQQLGNRQSNPTVVPGQNKGTNQVVQLDLEPYNNGFFSINKPRGWQVNTGGYGSTFCYSVQDPSQPLRQIVYYGEVGPAYLSERQKQLDQAAVNMGATVTWLDSPVVAPLTPENYLSQIPQILRGNFMKAVHIPPGPDWQNFQVIQAAPHKSAFVAPDVQCALIRALFTLNNQVGEGLFLVTVCTLMPENGNPFAGTGYSVCFTAVTAPQQEFRYLESNLIRSVGSAALSQQYLAEATKNANNNWQRIFAAGQTMRETSAIIMNGWEERNKTYDVISEQRADAIRGVERVYDKNTNQVYTVNNGWYEQYDQNRHSYQMNNLERVPNNSPLYLNPTLNGGRIH